MKILHLASGDLWAGAEVQLFHLARAISKQKDMQIVVVLLNHGQLERELINQNVNVIVFDEKQLSGFAVFKKLSRLIKKYKPDIVHTHRIKENVIGGFAAKFHGVKSIRTVHGAPELPVRKIDLKRFIYNALDMLSASLAQQKIVAVSCDLFEKLSNIYSLSKLALIDNCVDEDYILEKSKAPCKQMLVPGSFNVAFVGRLVPVKRVDFFYNIAKAVISNTTSKLINFHLIGDGPLKASVEEKIAHDMLGDRVCLHGFVENSAPLLKLMDLLVFTSDHEGLPMTLLESMTLGVPVMSRNLPSIKNALCNGSCGYIVATDNINDYCGLILQLANKGLDADKKAEAARRKIQERFNIHANTVEYTELYRSVLG